jgi:transposase
MRRSFDGLALAAQQQLGEDPRSGALFVFRNKGSNRLKVLWWDRNGFCLLYKRLHGARFVLPSLGGGRPSFQVDGPALAKLLAGEEKGPRRRV